MLIPLLTQIYHPISFTFSGSTIFVLLYLFIDKVAWKWPLYGRIFSYPNLNGEWECEGESFNKDSEMKYSWKAIVSIKQTWDKIQITLKTQNSQSCSTSIISGIKYIAGKGYILSYHYINEPNMRETELLKHEGFCSLTFDETLKTSEGFYFNNVKERKTYGCMKLRRRIV